MMSRLRVRSPPPRDGYRPRSRDRDYRPRSRSRDPPPRDTYYRPRSRERDMREYDRDRGRDGYYRRRSRSRSPPAHYTRDREIERERDSSRDDRGGSIFRRGDTPYHGDTSRAHTTTAPLDVVAPSRSREELRLTIDDVDIGAVLGKGGSVIKMLREVTKAGFEVGKPPEKCPKPADRIVTISEKAEKLAPALLKLIEQVATRGLTHSAVKFDEKSPAKISLLIHQLHCQHIIGPDGDTIREIQEQSNTRIFISTDPLPNTTDHSMLIYGSYRDIHNAAHLIIGIISANPLPAGTRINQYQPCEILVQQVVAKAAPPPAPVIQAPAPVPVPPVPVHTPAPQRYPVPPPIGSTAPSAPNTNVAATPSIDGSQLVAPTTAPSHPYTHMQPSPMHSSMQPPPQMPAMQQPMYYPAGVPTGYPSAMPVGYPTPMLAPAQPYPSYPGYSYPYSYPGYSYPTADPAAYAAAAVAYAQQQAAAAAAAAQPAVPMYTLVPVPVQPTAPAAPPLLAPGGIAPGYTTQRLGIPTICAGSLIGPKGATIQGIMAQSGAKVLIGGTDPSMPDERICVISGTETQVNEAIGLIRDKVESFKMPTTQ